MKVLEEAKVLPLIRSRFELSLFEVLSPVFPYVFKEVPAAGFINFDMIKDSLSPVARSKFFTLRYDFVCCDNGSLPVLAIEYNGKQHFRGPKRDDLHRSLKKRFCQLAGVDFISLNTSAQMDRLIREMDDIIFFRTWRSKKGHPLLTLEEEAWRWKALTWPQSKSWSGNESH